MGLSIWLLLPVLVLLWQTPSLSPRDLSCIPARLLEGVLLLCISAHVTLRLVVAIVPLLVAGWVVSVVIVLLAIGVVIACMLRSLLCTVCVLSLLLALLGAPVLVVLQLARLRVVVVLLLMRHGWRSYRRKPPDATLIVRLVIMEAVDCVVAGGFQVIRVHGVHSQCRRGFKLCCN